MALSPENIGSSHETMDSPSEAIVAFGAVKQAAILARQAEEAIYALTDEQLFELAVAAKREQQALFGSIPTKEEDIQRQALEDGISTAYGLAKNTLYRHALRSAGASVQSREDEYRIERELTESIFRAVQATDKTSE